MNKIYETIFQHSLDTIFIVDAKNRKIKQVNNRVTDFLGYTKDELLEKDFLILFPSKTDSSLSDILKETYAYDSVLVGQQFLCADGSTLTMDLTSIIHEIDGEKYIIVFLQAAKERNFIERKLFFNNDLFHSLMQNLPDYI